MRTNTFPRQDPLALPISHNMVDLLRYKKGDPINFNDADVQAAVVQAARIVKNAKLAAVHGKRRYTPERSAAAEHVEDLIRKGSVL